MPQLNDMFQNLAQDKYYTKIDLSKGYWQIPMANEDIPKTAFVLHDSKFEFLRTAFLEEGVDINHYARIYSHQEVCFFIKYFFPY